MSNAKSVEGRSFPRPIQGVASGVGAGAGKGHLVFARRIRGAAAGHVLHMSVGEDDVDPALVVHVAWSVRGGQSGRSQWAMDEVGVAAVAEIGSAGEEPISALAKGEKKRTRFDLAELGDVSRRIRGDGPEIVVTSPEVHVGFERIGFVVRTEKRACRLKLAGRFRTLEVF